MADISMKAKDENALLMLLGRLSRGLTTLTSWAGALVLFINVLVVFASVIWRYALHSPIHWAEEVARALMIALVFLAWPRPQAEAGILASICSCVFARAGAPLCYPRQSLGAVSGVGGAGDFQL